MSESILIESERWQLWLDPSCGVQWLGARTRVKAEWLDVCPDCRPGATDALPDSAEHQISSPSPSASLAQAQGDAPIAARVGQHEAKPLPAANFHMLPYSNRIRDGRFAFEGIEHQLQEAGRHAIHGALRKRPWRVTEQQNHHLTAVYDARRDGELNWPWPIEARISYTLDGPVLRGELQLTNRGQRAMPAGLGWHPYFVRVIKGVHPHLTLPVRGVYPDASGDCLPDGAAVPLPDALDFRHSRALDPDQRIDCCLNGLQGACELSWPGAGLRLRLSASDACDHLILFNPDMPHFAVEPVTNANDGINLQAFGIEAGIVTLEPGATLSATLTLEALTDDAQTNEALTA